MSIYLGDKKTTDIYIDEKKISNVYINTDLIYNGYSQGLTYEYEDGEIDTVGKYYRLTGIGTFTGGELSIPQYYDDGIHGLLPVLIINDEAFKDQTQILTVKIPEGCRVIASYAFSGCTALTSITIPDTVYRIHPYAFENCTSLTAIDLPRLNDSEGGVIGDYMFSGCENLTTVGLPNGFDTLSNHMFSNCNKLSKIGASIQTATTDCVLPPTLINIGGRTFIGCESLPQVTLPASLKTVGAGAFFNCDSLTKVNYTGTVNQWVNIDFTVAGSNTSNPIYYAKNLYINNELVTIANITSGNVINNLAFLKCESLTEVNISSTTLTRIGQYAFSGCTGLSKVSLPNGLTTISAYAFGYCSSLSTIDLPNSITTIDHHAFYSSGLTELSLPNSLTTIERYTFYACDIKDLSIPSTITSINEYAFAYCEELIGFYLLENSSGVTSCTTIKEYAFHRCRKLDTVGLTNGITTIGPHAFEHTRCRVFYVPRSLSANNVGSCAFNTTISTTGTDHFHVDYLSLNDDNRFTQDEAWSHLSTMEANGVFGGTWSYDDDTLTYYY